MELYQLKTFQMVAEEGHLTRAAKRLNASQPAVSSHIKTLEEEIGITLFTRTPKGMALTPEGAQLKAHADKVLTSVAEMVAHTASLRGTIKGDLRLGIHTEPDLLLIPELYSNLQSQHPDIHLHILQSTTGESLGRLENGDLDAAFIYGKPNVEKVHYVELQRPKLVVVAPAKWKLKLEQSRPEDLGAFPWVMTPGDCPFHDVTSALFTKYSIAPAEVARVDQESVIKTMVKAGMGISILLEQDLAKGAWQDDFAIWDEEDLDINLSITCLKRRKDEPMLKILMSVLSGLWWNNPPEKF